MSKQIDKAWAAGFFDGEGCTTVTICKPKSRALDKKRPQLGLRMSVAQVEIEPLERFFNAIDNIGAIRGPYQYSTNKQPHYQWNASNKDVLKVINLLWPYLSEPKQIQALVKMGEYFDYLEKYPPKVNQYGGLRNE